MGFHVERNSQPVNPNLSEERAAFEKRERLQPAPDINKALLEEIKTIREELNAARQENETLQQENLHLKNFAVHVSCCSFNRLSIGPEGTKQFPCNCGLHR